MPPDSPFQSRYTYPGTDTLKNYLSIRDPLRLHVVERAIAERRLMDLHKEPVHGKFDLFHLSAIHHAIFRDIYPFAGEVRTEEIAKEQTVFTPSSIIVPISAQLFSTLHRARDLRGMKAAEFIENAANLYLSMNAIHPFPEGNGRAQREFIRTLGLNAGYELDWSRVDKDHLLEATITSTYKPGDLSFQAQLERTLVSTEPSRRLQRTYDDLSRDRGHDR
jgi:cell filamentation protein